MQDFSIDSTCIKAHNNARAGALFLTFSKAMDNGGDSGKINVPGSSAMTETPKSME